MHWNRHIWASIARCPRRSQTCSAAHAGAYREALSPAQMSRTPLFRLLQRSYRAASYSITHLEPVDEVLDRRDATRQTRLVDREGRMSRRQFVAGTAAVAAVATLDACAPRTPTVPPTPRRTTAGRRCSSLALASLA